MSVGMICPRKARAVELFCFLHAVGGFRLSWALYSVASHHRRFNSQLAGDSEMQLKRADRHRSPRLFTTATGSALATGRWDQGGFFMGGVPMAVSIRAQGVTGLFGGQGPAVPEFGWAI